MPTGIEVFFGKFVRLPHPNLLKWKPTMNAFLGITEIMFWWVFQSSYCMESLQIIDKFCLSLSVIFLNKAYIFLQVIRTVSYKTCSYVGRTF